MLQTFPDYWKNDSLFDENVSRTFNFVAGRTDEVRSKNPYLALWLPGQSGCDDIKMASLWYRDIETILSILY